MGGTNTLGKSAKIGWSGSTSITLNDLVLQVTDARPGQFGLFLVGPLKTQQTFGGGFLCVAGNPQRLHPAVLLNALGAGSLAIDTTDPNSPASNIQPFSQWNFQFWYRDPKPTPPTFNLSNAAHLDFCP